MYSCLLSESLRGSRSSLDNEVFKSELSYVLENRRKSDSSHTGIDNPAFPAEVKAKTDVSSFTNAESNKMESSYDTSKKDDKGSPVESRLENTDDVASETEKSAEMKNSVEDSSENIQIVNEEGKFRTVVDVLNSGDAENLG